MTLRDLAALPKAHLHLHLDGALRRSTLQEACDALGIDAPRLPGRLRYGGFAAFMEAIRSTHAVLQDRAFLTRVVAEIVEDAAAEGAVWVELSVWPGVFGGLSAGGEAVEAILDAGHAAAQRHRVGFGLMIAANRHESPAAAADVARFAVDLRERGVASFGLDGDEAASPPEVFTDAFAVARHGGLLSTPHAGELRGADSVAAAVDLLHADRVLHGIRAVEDPWLLARLASSGVCLDVCPTSNVKLSVVADIAAHPLPLLLAAGVACTLNADDPLLFGSSLLGEYELARSALGLTDHDLAAIARASVDHSGASDRLKADARNAIRRWEGS
jgi:adenosine deaminase